MTIEMKTILDITKHSYDPASILDWMLEVWETEPGVDLMLITAQGDGAALDNRIRVKLSQVRRELKYAKVAGVQQFGLETSIIGWTHLDGTEREALTVHRKKTIRHTAMEAFDQIMGENHGQ